MQEEISEVVKRYESMLEENSKWYFDTNEFEQIGEYYLGRGEIENVFELCEYALTLFPTSLVIILLKCHALLVKGKLTECKIILNNCLNNFPENGEVFLLLASLNSRLKEHEKSVYYFKLALKNLDDPSLIDVKFDLVFELQASNNYSEAIQVLENILKENHLHEAALFELAYCFDVSNDFDSGVDYFTTFTDLHPYSHIAWFNLGSFLLKNSQLKNALHAFELSCAIDEEYVPAWINVGMIHMLNEDINEALKVFFRVIEIESEQDFVLCAIAECFEQLNDQLEAINFYQKAFEINPYNIEALHGLALIYKDQDKLLIARAYLEKAKEIDNYHEDINLFLAQINFLLDKDDAGERLLKEMLEHNPKSILFRIELAKYYFISDVEKALILLEEGLSVENELNSLTLRVYIIYFLHNNGGQKEAKFRLENLMMDYSKKDIEIELADIYPDIYMDDNIAGLFL